MQHTRSSYLRSKLRAAQAEIHSVETRYRVKSPRRLEEKIKAGSLEGHPVWEDLIQYENLVEQAEKSRRELDSIPR
jgi:hypothetical protein